MLLASCEPEKKDLVKENKIVTQFNNRSSNSVKADGFYHTRTIFISKSGGLLHASLFPTILIVLLELSI